MTVGVMSSQVKTLVDKGKILNYDACFQDPTVATLAQQNPVSGDDLNQSLAKDVLCRIYYNNAFWRGGVKATIDDRADNSTNNSWNSQASQQSQTKIDTVSTDFSSQLDRVKQAIVSLHLYGNTNDASNISSIKNDIENSISKINKETANLEVVLTALKKDNSDDMLQSVAKNEDKIRQMSDENDHFRKGNELRREQAKDLYNRFGSNYHSSAFGYFGYNPIHPSSQSALIFTSLLMGIIGLFGIGIKAAPFLFNTSSVMSSLTSLLSSTGASKTSILPSLNIKKAVLSRY